MTTVGNAEPVSLGGVGLVVGLEGTGGEPAADNYRTDLEDRPDPRKDQGHQKGAGESESRPRRGDGPACRPAPSSATRSTWRWRCRRRSGKATSLRGGYLRMCTLYNYDYTKHLNPNYERLQP